MTSKRTIATLALLPSGILALHAQPSAIQQLQNNQLIRQLEIPAGTFAGPTNAPELYTGENADVGPQHILRQTPRHKYFDLLFDSQVFETDNANYAPDSSAVSSVVFVNTVQAAFTPPTVQLGEGKVATAIGVASQWYNYGNVNSLDFEAETFFVSGKYTIGKWQVGLGASLTRLVNQGDYSETYREFMPNLGVQRIIPLNDRMFFAIGDLVDYHLTQVPKVLLPTVPVTETRSDLNDRLDDVASITFTWQATRHLLIQPYYRFEYSYYQLDTQTTSDRSDCLQSFGVTAAYYFNADFSVRAFYNFNRRQSSDPLTSEYREMNGGLGLSLDLRF